MTWTRGHASILQENVTDVHFSPAPLHSNFKYISNRLDCKTKMSWKVRLLWTFYVFIVMHRASVKANATEKAHTLNISTDNGELCLLEYFVFLQFH